MENSSSLSIGDILGTLSVLGTAFLIFTQTSMPHAANVTWTKDRDENGVPCHILTFLYKTSISAFRLRSIQISGYKIHNRKGGGYLREEWAKDSYECNVEYAPEDPACRFRFACFPCSEESKSPVLILRCRFLFFPFTHRCRLEETRA